MPLASNLTANIGDFNVALLESIRENPVELYSKFPGLSQKIGGMRRVEKVNDRAYKILQKAYSGGTLQKINYDGGSYGVGSGPRMSQMFGGIFYGTFGVELTAKAMSQTEKRGSGMDGGATTSIFAESVGDAMETMVMHFDRYIWGTGDGVLTNAAAATSTPSAGYTAYDFTNATDYITWTRLVKGMAVAVADSALSTFRANGSRAGFPFIVDSINDTTNQVILLGTVTGAASTDRLTVVGLAGNGGPSLPVTFQSGWPLTPATGDSWMHGIPYANDATGSNYYLGVQRSTRPELLAKNVNLAGTSYWNSLHTQQFRDKILNACGPEALTGLEGYCHMAQRLQAQSVGLAISNFPKTQSTGIVDPLPGTGPDGMTAFEFGEIRHNIYPMQDKSRIDYINWSLWEKVEDFPGPRPLMTNNGEMGFTIIDTTTGGQTTRKQWMWEFSGDWVCVDPWRQGYISNIQVPAGS